MYNMHPRFITEHLTKMLGLNLIKCLPINLIKMSIHFQH